MNLKIFAAIFLIFGIGLMSGYIMRDFFSYEKLPDKANNESYQVRQMGEYSFINPLLECEVAEGTIDARKQNFRNDLHDFISDLEKRENLSRAAVFYRDMNNGPTFGVSETEVFFPASLLKVPIMIVYFHLAEKNESLLDREIQFERPIDFGYDQQIVPKDQMEPGFSYSVDNLIRRMILFSDNQAAYLLASAMPENALRDLFSLVGINKDALVDPRGRLSVKEYSSFFRILYNSSYLSREYSERSLQLLSEANFQDGLRRGVPENIPIAKKFGETSGDDGEQQLHDCGIVYFPNHPYLACIMTKGKDSEALKRSVTEISRFIYERVEEQY